MKIIAFIISLSLSIKGVFAQSNIDSFFAETENLNKKNVLPEDIVSFPKNVAFPINRTVNN